MILTKKHTDAFTKIIKRGMEQYKVVPHSLGNFSESNEQGVVGYVSWRDPDAHFTTDKGDTNQEFYIKIDGTVNVYTNNVFIPVNFRAKNWANFCNPKTEGSEEC